MIRKNYKEALEIRVHVKHKTLSKEKILKKYEITERVLERIIGKETFTKATKKRNKNTYVKGEKCGLSKFKETHIKEVLKLWEKGVSHAKIASFLSDKWGIKISSSNVSKITVGESWNSVVVDYCSKMLEKQIKKIDYMHINLKKARIQRFYLKDKLTRLAKVNRKKRASLTELDVKMILFYKGICTAEELQVMTSKRVSLGTIYDILNGDSWKHLQKGDR